MKLISKMLEYGKAMDFEPSLDHFNLNDDQKNYVADYSLLRILKAFSSLDIFDNIAAEKVVESAKASFESANQK